ncbi:dihydrodipicolinate synthase family protein [Pseudodesulfovibrio sp. F-1]|uniref:Dihydrodipicolinate synthase family protein n=1 Tax=Pseudodesulfovibrio alkaliphilus TaxID=2661613 RepID=A0A7K1KP05_9BACT|nr:dihydrodipicolinate synthase family protein [Pseudodesulfovibrio alkaliphilus]MUM77814.1 dihydrodipicolinate synthase family protein [Pseudodesulfovibrio alkaliphilus]
MIETRAINGVVPVVLTPFTEDESIDVPALERVVEFVVSKPIGGMWVLGTGSEDMNLTFDKRLEVARVVSRVNAGRKPLILGAGFYALEESLSFMEQTADMEVDGYHVMPYHPLLSQDRLKWLYETLADAASKPLWMYTSGNWSAQLNINLLVELKKHPNIAGIKYSNVNAVLAGKVCAMAEPEFQVVTAVASQHLASLVMGSKAHTSSLGSALPEPMIQIYDLFQAGDMSGALKAQRKLNKFLSIFASCTKKDNFIQAADEKYVMSLRGLCEPRVSSYYRESTGEEREAIRAGLRELGLVEGEVWEWTEV